MLAGRASLSQGDTTWFGYFVPTGNGWIYHVDWEWAWVTESSDSNSVWFYSIDYGWLWTSQFVYPSVYSAEHEWLIASFDLGDDWFFVNSLQEWVGSANLKNDLEFSPQTITDKAVTMTFSPYTTNLVIVATHQESIGTATLNGDALDPFSYSYSKTSPYNATYVVEETSGVLSIYNFTFTAVNQGNFTGNSPAFNGLTATGKFVITE